MCENYLKGPPDLCQKSLLCLQTSPSNGKFHWTVRLLQGAGAMEDREDRMVT